MKSISTLRAAIVLMGVLFTANSLSAKTSDNFQYCANCEAMVVLDPTYVNEFTNALMTISSIPLYGLVMDNGMASGYGQILVATDPEFATANGLDSFDIAKKLVGIANAYQFGIRTVAAIWVSQLNK